jgi:hypothetical protein
MSQQWGSYTAAAAVAVGASKMFPSLADISVRRRQTGDPSQGQAFLDRKAAVSHKTRTWAAARMVEGDTEELHALRALGNVRRTCLASPCGLIHLSSSYAIVF